MPSSIFGAYYTQVRFTDVWSTADDFLSDYQDNGIGTTISTTNAQTLYYLLYSRFGNSVIAASDTNRFKYDLFGTIFSYGPTWERRMEIQDSIRNLSDNDLFVGATYIVNHAYNPGTEPSTSTLDELTAINEQNTNKTKKDKLGAYAMLMSLLKTDVTEEFLNKFKRLFITVVEPQEPLWYVTDGEEDSE